MKAPIALIAAGALIVLSIIFVPSMVETVPAGHVKVGTLFGKVQQTTLSEGFHFVNPFVNYHKFDCREKTIKVDGSAMPSRDQLTTSIDWSIQYRADCKLAANMLRDTGDVESVVGVHLTPNFRSIIREKGKKVENAEDYFKEDVQTEIQKGVLSDLSQAVASKGIQVSDILLRNVKLPPVIQKAIEQKKQREQETQKQEAELARFTVEQNQKVAQARAESEAAKLKGAAIRELARAEAEANREVASSLTKNLVEYRAIESWNGELPRVTGDVVPFLDIDGD